MTDKQRTIEQPVTIKGKGLHSGINVELTFKPAPENHGYIFKRTDLENQPIIHACVENVTETSRGTTLEENGAKVATIEHVMASLVGLRIDNVLMEINGPEAPIMDGSSILIVEALKQAGIIEQNAERDYFVIKEKIVYSDEEKGVDLIAYPDDMFSINVLIDYNSPVLGNQYAIVSSMKEFEKQIAPCRTFVFFHELEILKNHNLIKGGDLDNAIVILNRKVEQEEIDRIAGLFNKPSVKAKPEGILNNVDLRFNNEPARHKLLDLIGDMALIGRPIKGKIVATRPGHYANTEFGKKIKQVIKKESSKDKIPHYDPSEDPLYDINKIKTLLPHRYPFLLVDKVIHVDESCVVGLKNVTANEAFFMGHFPEEPVMPGVLQVEAMAQVGGILVLGTVPDPENYSTYFLKIDKVKFKRKVIPGDTVLFKMELLEPVRRGIVHMFGQAFVGRHVVMEGELMAQIVKDKE